MGKNPKSKKTTAAASTQRIEDGRADESNQDETNSNNVLSLFPKSEHYVKVLSFGKKGNQYKANKILLRGSEHGCTYCLTVFAQVLCYNIDVIIAAGCFPDVLTPAGGFIDVLNYSCHHKNLHIALPICLEGVIRGSFYSFCCMSRILSEFRMLDEGESRPDYLYSNNKSQFAIINYWSKYYDKQGWLPDSYVTVRKEYETKVGNCCHGCDKIESETVTLEKCGRCNYYYYCSIKCQKKRWEDGHAGECNHLAILKKYHRPHGKHIRNSLINGIDPKNVPELQELRHRLGLDKPTTEYEVLLEQAKSGRITPIELVTPNKDGTVQIGSFPHPM